MPEITVCLPCFNGAEFLREAIDSVLAQDFTDFEFIILYDKSSSDKGDEIIKLYNDKRIVVCHLDFCTMADKLNIGFGVARGNYLTWICADDMWNRSFLSKSINMMRRNKSLDLVYSDYSLLVNRNGKWEENRQHQIATIWKGNPTLYQNNHCGIFWLFKKELFKKVGHFYNVSGEDFDFMLRVAEQGGSCECINEKLGIWRKHPKQTSEVINNDNIKKQVRDLANKRGNYGQPY